MKVELGKYSSKMFVYVTEIKEDCIVGAHFFLRTGVGKLLRSAILESLQEKKQRHFLSFFYYE